MTALLCVRVWSIQQPRIHWRIGNPFFHIFINFLICPLSSSISLVLLQFQHIVLVPFDQKTSNYSLSSLLCFLVKLLNIVEKYVHCHQKIWGKYVKLTRRNHLSYWQVSLITMFKVIIVKREKKFIMFIWFIFFNLNTN